MEKRGKFSGKIGFVLAAAGSAVGLGNIWRFPYLAAKYGGGIFILVYLVLAFTFGYTMIMAESALGRRTGKSPVGAFKKAGAGKFLMAGGWINSIIPLLIVPYYSVIGGWVLKYLFTYIKGDANVSNPDFFGNYIGNGWHSATENYIWFAIFVLVTAAVIFLGVKNGIEKVSKLVMPVLIVLCLVVTIFSCTRPGALQGVKYVLVPDFARFSWKTVVAAMGQMFYSLSIAMGILVTFGSYMKKEIDMESSTGQVEIFDTAIAIMAALMIIPVIFSYGAGQGMSYNETVAMAQSKGPGLMFSSLPQVFATMAGGRYIGIVFFLLVFFAAMTSAVALTESVVSTMNDELGWSRKKGTVISLFISLALGLLSCWGFNVLSGVTPLKMDFLSFFDFLTNSVMMPIAAIATVVLIVKVIKIDRFEEEITSTSKFRRKPVFEFVLKYLALIFLLVILISSVLDGLGIVKI